MRRQSLTINGHHVACYTAGNGPTVLLVHGMAGSSATWKHVIPALARRFTIVAPDLLGHGKSAKPRGEYGTELARVVPSSARSGRTRGGSTVDGQILAVSDVDLILRRRAPERGRGP